MSASLAAVPVTVCTTPEATSTPICAFIPKTDHGHVEVALWRHRRGTHLRRVIGLARRFDNPVETGRDQHLLKPVVKHVSWPARHLRPGHHQIALPIALPPHRHSANPVSPSA